MAFKFVLPWLFEQTRKRLEVKAEDALGHDAQAGESREPLNGRLQDNEAWLKQTFAQCSDLMIRHIQLFGSLPCLLVFFRELVDSKQLDEELLKAQWTDKTITPDAGEQVIEQLRNELVPVVQTTVLDDQNEIMKRIIRGEVVLFVEASARALAFSMKERLHRALKEPDTEAVIRGPKVGFIENLEVNMALIRQLIRTPQLKMEQMYVGSVSQTGIAVIYLENTASPEVVAEVKGRLAKITLETVLPLRAS